MADLQQLTREFQSLGRQRRGQLAAAATSPEAAASDQGLTFRTGARVLDLVTGEEGIIVDGTAEHIVTSAG